MSARDLDKKTLAKFELMKWSVIVGNTSDFQQLFFIIDNSNGKVIAQLRCADSANNLINLHNAYIEKFVDLHKQLDDQIKINLKLDRKVERYFK